MREGFLAWSLGGDMWHPQENKKSVSAPHGAMDLGINAMDTAKSYGKGDRAPILGLVLKESTEENCVITKVPLELPRPCSLFGRPAPQGSWRASTAARSVKAHCGEFEERALAPASSMPGPPVSSLKATGVTW
jgi:aryl-alcohol dehydrogenase-like predicted oxidoreductase